MSALGWFLLGAASAIAVMLLAVLLAAWAAPVMDILGVDADDEGDGS